MAPAIYTGVWFNHDVDKLILTLSPRAAGFLIAALVTWVHLVAISTWPIFRYFLYTARQTSTSTEDVFHRQRQVMLRNSNSAAGAAGQLLKMGWAWRKYHVRSFLRTLIYLIISVTIFVIWTLCGLYAPYIYTRTSTEVLLRNSSHCGWPVPPDTSKSGIDVFNLFAFENINAMTAADAYVQRCYDNTSSTAQCNNYPRQSFDLTLSDDVCPFGESGEVCISVNSTVMRLDTGLLDSNKDFGVNLKKKATLQYRRVSTCSPLHTAAFVDVVNTTGTPLASQYPEGEVLLNYLYGPAEPYDFTYQYEYNQMFYPIPYTLQSEFYSPAANAGSFIANSTFYNQTDGDVSIVFVAGNKVQNPEPVYDPVFAAGLNAADVLTLPYNSTTNITVYDSTHAVVPIACKEQHQICLAGEGRECTPLMGYTQLINETVKLKGFDWGQLVALGRISYILPAVSISSVITDRGAGALLASRTLNGVGQTAALPMDQWRKEVTNWHKIALARMQGLMLSYVTGPDNEDLIPYVEKPNNASIAWGCKSQRVRDPQNYQNFDMVGLLVLVVVGAGFIFLGLTFETVIRWISKLSSRLRTRRAKWLSEGLYHLHKNTLEAQGIRDWQDLDSVMPKSQQQQPGQRFGSEEHFQSVSFLQQQMSTK